MKVNWKQVLAFGWPVVILIGILAVRSISGLRQPAAGETLYVRHCASCHMEDGKGLGALIPPLAQADWLKAHNADIACLIRYGNQIPMEVNGVLYDQEMPGNQLLSPAEITYLINYIRQAWGNDLSEVSYQQVNMALDSCSNSEG